jgi:hypothetical protein
MKTKEKMRISCDERAGADGRGRSKDRSIANLEPYTSGRMLEGPSELSIIITKMDRSGW